MAKDAKDAKDAPAPGVDSAYKPQTYVDFDDPKEVAGLSLGDEVTVVVRGTICSISQREDTMTDKPSASICLEDFEAEVVTKKTQFDDLFGDD